MYPSRLSYGHGAALRDAWLSNFSKHNLTIAFECHDHTYKRTKLLRNGRVDPAGTLFIGDGNLGVSSPSPRAQDRWYIQVTKKALYVALSCCLFQLLTFVIAM